MSGAPGPKASPNHRGAFWLESPAEAVASAPGPDDTPVAVPSPGRTLLLVDDIAMNRDVLGAFLREAGYTVVLGEGGRQAIALASGQTFDLILMDVRMPEMDGLDATRHIRELPGARGKVAVLALTAYAYPEQVAACRLAGMDGYVAKPVDYGTLIRAIENTIAGTAPPWPNEPPASARGQDEEQPPPRLDRAVLEKMLAFLPPAEVVTNLQLLRVRKEQMVRLLDQSADVALLMDAAHALGSAAGMFGFVALAKMARRFERVPAGDGAELARIGQFLRVETCAALAALDGPLYEKRLGFNAADSDVGHGVIVVENDPLVRGIIRAVLRYAKQQVFLAADGLEAVVLATQFKARLVLLDIGMPRLNGLLACEAIRAQPGYADVPIVMLTGYGDERMHRAAQRLGSSDFITKPFRPDVLLARLEALLDDAPVRPLRGVFLDVPAPSPEASIGDDDGDCLRGGWVKIKAEPVEGPHVPLKGLRHSVEGVLHYAGIPPNLVQKWLGYAQVSPATIECEGVGSVKEVLAPAKLGFLD